MKFLFKYSKFNEAYKGPSRSYNSINNYVKFVEDLKNNPIMNDILALIPNISYKVEKSGLINFGRSLGGESCITKDENGYTFHYKEPNGYHSETHLTLPEVLREFWSYLVSRKTKAPFNKNITRNIIKDKYQGERKSIEQILNLECVIIDIDDENINKLIEIYKKLGLRIKNYKDNCVDIDTCLTINKDSFLYSIIKGINSGIIVLNYTDAKSIKIIAKKGQDEIKSYSLKCKITPRNKDEILLMCLEKISKIFKYSDEIKIGYNSGSKKDLKIKYLPLLISDFTDEIIKNINNINDETILECIYISIINSRNANEILNNLKINNFELFNSISKLAGDETKFDDVSDLAELGL